MTNADRPILARLVRFLHGRLLKVGRDPRGYMREAYRLFGGEGSEEELRAVAANGPADEFYSLLYVGLWREARWGVVCGPNYQSHSYVLRST